MEHLYSITQSGGKSLVKFATPPPEIITNELKRDKFCKWLTFQKQWSCPIDAQFIMKLERDLKELGWQRVKEIEAKKTSLSATVAVEDGNIVIKFNRNPDQSIRQAISSLDSSRDLRDKRLWFLRYDDGNKQKLTETFAKFPNLQVSGLDLRNQVRVNNTGTDSGAGAQVAFELDGSTLKLHFQSPPPPSKIHKIKGALQMLGFKLTDNTLPVQENNNDDGNENIVDNENE